MASGQGGLREEWGSHRHLKGSHGYSGTARWHTIQSVGVIQKRAISFGLLLCSLCMTPGRWTTPAMPLFAASRALIAHKRILPLRRFMLFYSPILRDRHRVVLQRESRLSVFRTSLLAPASTSYTQPISSTCALRHPAPVASRGASFTALKLGNRSSACKQKSLTGQFPRWLQYYCQRTSSGVHDSAFNAEE